MLNRRPCLEGPAMKTTPPAMNSEHEELTPGVR